MTYPFPHSGGVITPPHQYWRLYITATGGMSWISFPTLDLFEVVGGSNIATGGSAIASSSYPGEGPSNLFDGNSATVWSNSSPGVYPEWAYYNFGTGVKKNIVQIGMQTRSGFPSMCPTSFLVQWSDDASTWTTKGTVSGASAWSDGEYRRFAF